MRIVRYEPHQPFLIGHVVLKDFFARRVIGLGPGVAGADVVGGKAPFVIRIAVVKLHEIADAGPGGDVASQQRVTAGS